MTLFAVNLPVAVSIRIAPQHYLRVLLHNARSCFDESNGSVVVTQSEIMEGPGKLRIEQDFRLQLLKDAVASANHEQLEEFLIELARQLMLKDNWIQHMFKECYFSDMPSISAQ